MARRGRTGSAQALYIILHYLVLRRRWCPVKLGLTAGGNQGHAYLRYVDPGLLYTDGGTLIFRATRPGSIYGEE
ncbi:MAG: hypothetical protein ACLFPN_05825 [Methanomassiliicoccales archaeon]